MHKVHLRLALASATFLGLAGSAFALDGADFLAKINKNYEESGVSIAAASVDVDGSDVSMTGVTYKPPGADAKPVAVGDIEFTGVEEDDDGNYNIEEIQFPDMDVKDDKSQFTATDLTLSGVFISATPGEKSVDSLAPFESAQSGPITVSENGKQVMSLESMEAKVAVRDDESGIDYEWATTGLKADLTDTPDPKAKEAIEKLGLQTIEGNISMKASWQLEKGTSSIEAFTLDFKDIGKLNIALSVSGLTLDLIKKVEEASKQMNDSANKEAASQAAGLQFMGLIQQLTFDSAEIRFDDASITKRALDYAGQQQGVSGEQLAQSLKAMVPLMVGQLNMPDLQNALSTAAATYLDSPKNITVSAKPAAPVAFPMIMGAAMGAPNTIPQVLGVTVTANN